MVVPIYLISIIIFVIFTTESSVTQESPIICSHLKSEITAIYPPCCEADDIINNISPCVKPLTWGLRKSNDHNLHHHKLQKPQRAYKNILILGMDSQTCKKIATHSFKPVPSMMIGSSGCSARGGGGATATVAATEISTNLITDPMADITTSVVITNDTETAKLVQSVFYRESSHLPRLPSQPQSFTRTLPAHKPLAHKHTTEMEQL